jgi:FlgD Ig-like domain
MTFPAPSTSHPDTVYSLSSSGVSGEPPIQFPSDLDVAFGPSFQPGDEIWGMADPAHTGVWSVAAGVSPTIDINVLSCTAGTITGALYDRPRAPATISGVSTGSSTASDFPFVAPSSGQYVLDATLDEGALQFHWVDSTGMPHSVTIASSGETPLGSLTAGDQDILVNGLSGPTADYSLTVRELPVAISVGSFGHQFAAPGTILTLPFSASGDTTVTGYVENSGGQIVRHLGSFAVQEGSSSITWDTREDGGVTPPDGTYMLVLTSSDPSNNVSTGSASVIVDGTPPSVSMTSPSTIRPSQSISFSVTDALSGVASISLLVDGQDVEDFGGSSGNQAPNGAFSDPGPWSVGRHTWEIQAADNVGNESDLSGTFEVANPRRPRVTSANATSAFGRWIRARFGAGLQNYWICPKAQIFNHEGECLAEVHTGNVWRMIWATVKQGNSGLRVGNSHLYSWTRHWSGYSTHVIAGFHTPGRAQVNSPAYDWAWLATGADYEFRHHERSFLADGYDGPSAGFGKFFIFKCKVDRALIRCTNSFGDSMKYRP